MAEQLLTHTPPWVFVVFVVLLVYGITQLKTRAMGGVRVAVLPAIMTALSIGGVLTSFGTGLNALAAWLAGFVAAVALNRVIGAPAGVRFDAATRTFHIPGSSAPLWLMMAIFSAKYVVGATTAMRPEVAATATFALVLSAVFGALSGTFFGRFLTIRASTRQTAEAKPQDGPGAAPVRSAS